MQVCLNQSIVHGTSHFHDLITIFRCFSMLDLTNLSHSRVRRNTNSLTSVRDMTKEECYILTSPLSFRSLSLSTAISTGLLYIYRPKIESFSRITLLFFELCRRFGFHWNQKKESKITFRNFRISS